MRRARVDTGRAPLAVTPALKAARLKLHAAQQSERAKAAGMQHLQHNKVSGASSAIGGLVDYIGLTTASENYLGNPKTVFKRCATFEGWTGLSGVSYGVEDRHGKSGGNAGK